MSAAILAWLMDAMLDAIAVEMGGSSEVQSAKVSLVSRSAVLAWSFRSDARQLMPSSQGKP